MPVLWFKRPRAPLTQPYPENRLIFDVLPGFELMDDDRVDYMILPDLSKLNLEEILSEAIYFFNFKNTIIRKENWTPISKSRYKGVLEDLRWYFHNNYATWLHNTYNLSSNPDSKTYFGLYYNEDMYPFERTFKSKHQPAFWDPANRARYTVRKSLSPLFRTNKFDEIHYNKRNLKGNLYGIKLDEIAGKLINAREKMSKLISNLPNRPSYSVTVYWIYEINRRQNIFNGYLGKVFNPILSTFKASNPHAELDPSPLQYLTEYLYIAIQHRSLGENYIKIQNTRQSRLSPAMKGTIYSDFYEYLKELDANISILFKPNWSYLLTYYKNWEAQIDELYNTFALQNGQDETLRALLGIDWALILILTLKWYLTDLKLRIFMTSMPVWYFYTTRFRNSYIGLSLWEALSGWALKSPSIPNIMNVEFPVEDSYKVKNEEDFVQQDIKLPYINPKPNSRRDLIGDIGVWKDLVKVSPLPNSRGSSERLNSFIFNAELSLDDFSQNMLIMSSYKQRGKKRTFESKKVMSLVDDFIKPFHPVLQRGSGNVSKSAESLKLKRPDFFEMNNVIRNPVSLMNFGARFSAQLQYYVANEIIGTVGELLGLTSFYENQKSDNETNKKAELKQLSRDLSSLRKPNRTNLEQKSWVEKRLEYQRLTEVLQFAMNSGNYLGAGSFPPHKTHRDGRHYDTNMGPDTIPWRATNLHKILKSAYDLIKEYGTEEDQKLVNKFNTNYPIHRAEQVPGDIIKKNLMLLHYTDLRDHADTELSKIYNASVDDVKDLEKAEAQLYGTPHYQIEDDVELSQIATTAILISGPERIVYSSPLIFGRALWQIKKEFKRIEDQINDEIGTPEFQEVILPDVMEVMHPTRGCDFAFLPADHHNHWHIYYRKDKPLKWLQKVKILWMYLDIDLTRFITYLEDHEKFKLLRFESNDKFGTFSPVVKEWKEVLEFCKDYEQEKSILNSYSYWSEGDALGLMESIFLPFSVNGGNGKLIELFAFKRASSDLRRMSQALHEHLFKVKGVITRLGAITEKEKEKEKITKVLYDMQEEFGLNPERMTYEQFLENFGELDGEIIDVEDEPIDEVITEN